MINHRLKNGILGVVLLALPHFGIAQVPDSQTDGPVRFISGGIGLDESTSIRLEAKKWPVFIEFSKREGGKALWISEVSVNIIDLNGKQIFNQINQGPMLLLALKPGRYNIQATYLDMKMNRPFIVNQAQTQKISFQWK